MPPMIMNHDQDPKQELIENVGDISDIEMFNTQVLVAIYVRPQKTKSGIILTDKTIDEDRYQGKVGLIIKKGPDAFIDNEGKWFANASFSVGDWVVFRPSDGWAVSVNGQPCRILDDVSVKMRIKSQSPDKIW